MERIYIGGLEPLRLPVSEVVERLETSLPVEVAMHDVSVGTCYCHVNVSINRADDASNNALSAFDMIHKLYNNVKWKGCKLKVERARPHFLERLINEIAQRNRPVEVNDDNVRGSSSCRFSYSSSSATGIPRHLRIRRRYGQPAIKVDTRPVHVNDTPSLGKWRCKLASKREKHKVEGNRAIHWKWTAEADSKENNLLELGAARSPLAAVAAVSSYPHTSNGEGAPSRRADVDATSTTPTTTDSDTTGTASSNQPSGHIVPEPAYVWSDEESDVDSEMLVDDTVVRSIDNDEDNDDALNVDLTQDVANNLSILAQLFPDSQRHDMQRDAGTLRKKSPPSQRGWDATGQQMLRYDPTKEVPPPESEMLDVDSVASTNVRGEEDGLRTDGVGDDVAATVPAREQVYEEKMLEQVFQQARRSVATDQNAEPPSAEGSDAFAFGFQVMNDQSEPAQTHSTTFSFDFDLQLNDERDAILNDRETTGDGEEKEATANKTTSSPDATSDINGDHVMIEFPVDPMPHVRAFLQRNHGARMLQDVTGWRQDPNVSKAWNERRKSLTLDWKRKHKYAISRRKIRPNTRYR